MARLIDVNDVYSLFDKDGFATLHVTDIDTIPRADAVEVVRCGFCKNAEPYDCTINGTAHRLYECKKDKAAIVYNKVVAKDDFCSCGERKVGDRNG